MEIHWKTSSTPVPYEEALLTMEKQVEGILQGIEPEMVWLLEHPPVYTAGTSADAQELLTPKRFPVHYTGRGGKFTYHGPGQRVAYIMLNLKERRQQDVRRYVYHLEEWIIRTLHSFGIEGFRREGRTGIWVIATGGNEAKIAAIGVRIRQWVTFHGIAINVTPNLEHFTGIVPCGIDGYGVTSLESMGIKTSLSEVDAALKKEFPAVFENSAC